MVWQYWLVLGSTFILSVLINGQLISWAKRRQIFMPAIRPRDAHTTPTPRVGGIAIVAAFLVTIGVIVLFQPAILHFTNRAVLGVDRNLFGLLLAVIFLGIVNAYDDYQGLSWPVKLAAQLVAAVIITAFGISISGLSNPVGGQISLGHWSAVIVVIWLVVVSNVINWLDSIDGVAGGVSAIALLVLFFLSITTLVNQPANAALALIGLGATLGFLVFNLRGQTFLGDTGTIFLGFLIGVLAIISGGKVATVFLVLAVPFLDAVVVFFARLLAHQSPFLPDRRHLIHRLIDRGYSRRAILLFYYAVSLVFGLIALSTQTLGKLWAIIAALILMTVIVLATARFKPTINKDERA